MKKGAYKKILFGIFSAFFVLGLLIAPTPKTEKASADDKCEVVKAVMIPHNNGKDSDAVNVKKFYLERPASGAPVKIQVEVKNCTGYTVSVTLVEGGSSQDVVAGYVDTISKQKGSPYTSGLGPYENIKTNDDSTIDFNFLAGEDQCAKIITDTGSDCQYYFKVFLNKGVSTSYKPNILNGDYDSSSDSINGNLYYSMDGGFIDFKENDAWVYKGSTVAQNAPIQTGWFYKLTGGKWFNSNKFTQKECEAERDKAENTGADKATPCTQTPPADELADGALSGQADATPECTILYGFADPDCVLAVIKAIIFTPVAWLAAIAGQFFDALFSFSISSQIYGGGGEPIGFLKVAWTFIRDLANLGFIISLLWLAVKQIIDPTVNEAKKQIPKIIIIALMINFSYFFGTIIIDTTNVLARFLYTNDAICINKDGQCDGTISEAIVASFNPQTIIERSSVELQKATGETEMSTASYAIILLLSIWACWLMAKMFFKLATLFLGRIIQLWAHLVLSPFAFIAYILPVKIPTGKMKGLSSPKDWASEFFRNAFIAPLFMFFMYLIFLVLSKFDFVKTQFATHGHSSFIAIITLIFPIFVVTMLMKSATDATESQAGSIANAVTGYINKAVGAVAGTALALGGLAAGGLIVKGGSKLLGSVSKRMIAKEGTGTGKFGRAFNSRVAKMGGYVNDYAKKLPDKKMDIRENKFLSGGVKNITGFDMTSGKDGINNVLRRGAGLRPDETFNQKIDRKAKAEEADVERRKISEKTNKMDNELDAIYKKRQADLDKELESSAYKIKLMEAKAAAERSGATFDENKWQSEWVTQKKIDIAGSEDLFKASSRKAYEDAAKAYNKKVDTDFVNKKKRDIYGGKTQAETEQNFKDNKKSGPGGQANPGDLAAAGGKTWGTALAGGIAGAAAATGAGVAGGALFASEAAYQRDGDLEFLRRREMKRKDAEKNKKTKDKIEAEIEDKKIIGERLAAKVEELSKSLDKHTQSLVENSATFKTSTGEQTKAFKDFFTESLKKMREENPDASENLVNLKSFNEAHSLYTDHVNQKLAEFDTAIAQAKNSEKQTFDEFEAFTRNNPGKEVPKDLEKRYAEAEKKLKESIPGVVEQRASLERHLQDINAKKNKKISMEEDFEKVYDRKTKNDNIIETLSKKKDGDGAGDKKVEEKKDEKK